MLAAQKSAWHVWLLVLVCVALLSTRLTGAHLHLCLDGSEPPASVHFVDTGCHGNHHVDNQHNDVDVPLVADALSKSGKSGIGLDLLLVLLSVFVWAWQTITRPRPIWHPPRALATASPPFLRPPLRGPPLHAT
jgi:hypothetical protein